MTESPLIRRLFLGVDQSATGRVWRDRLDAPAAAQAQAMVQQHGMADLLARVIAGRRVPLAEAPAWLNPTVRSLMPDPDVLQDMPAAVTRLQRAVEKHETVAIFGDYDVDGASSSALIADFLELAGARCIVHIPDRIFEGYGPNRDAIDRLADAGATLLVTVDCGTTSHEPLAHAKARGMDVVVIDHHQAPVELPAVEALVNPNRQDDLSGLGSLCAAGVVFMTIVGLNRALRRAGWWTSLRPEPDLLSMLDLVALATVADVVPLVGLNRAFVVKGIEVMKARGRPGLAALFDVAKTNGPPLPWHLGFHLGPRINAGGRIGDATLGVTLLRMTDPVEAARIAGELDRLNRERQVIEVATVEEAEAEALASLGLEERGAAVVTAGDDWHPGVAGLVAARLKEKFRRPAFAIAFTGDTGVGSGRSVPGVDLGRAVREAVEQGLLVKGGGHAMAAGVTIRRERLGDFRGWLEERLHEAVSLARENDSVDIDAALTASGATAALVQSIEKAGPYGSGNPEPVFALPQHRLVDLSEVGENHLRVGVQAGDGARLTAMAFRAKDTPLHAFLKQKRGEPIHLAGALSIDRYRGEARAQMRVVDAADPARGHRR